MRRQTFRKFLKIFERSVYSHVQIWYTETMIKPQLIFINGTMGVGKTALSLALTKRLPRNVFLDGDNCWNMRPFLVNDATKAMVLSNVSAVLNGFLASNQFYNILFCWVMHEQSVTEEILSRLNGDFDFRFFTLVCEEEELVRRLQRDISAGLRDKGVIERSLERRRHFQNMPSVPIDTTALSAKEGADKIARLLMEQDLTFTLSRALGEDERNIRKDVFITEQGFQEEFDETDKICLHGLLRYRGEAAGCCRLIAEQNGCRIGRVALKNEFRGCGLGKYLLSFAEEEAKKTGAAFLTVSAQTRACGFYEQCGFSRIGKEFSEEGCPHIEMRKILH